MSELKVTGKVKKVYPTQQISDTFKKRELIIETDETYPQILKLEFVQGAVDKIDDSLLGQDVICYFNLRGREFQGKDGKMMYFTSLNCWKIEKEGTTASYSSSSEMPGDSDDDGTLPF